MTATLNLLTGKAYPRVAAPCYIESTITTLPTRKDGGEELWKLNHYYERLDDWNGAHGIAKNPFAEPAADSVFEMHNLTTDPQERHNRADHDHDTLHQVQSVLDAQRDSKRKLPAHRNPVG